MRPSLTTLLIAGVISLLVGLGLGMLFAYPTPIAAVVAIVLFVVGLLVPIIVGVVVEHRKGRTSLATGPGPETRPDT